MQKVHTGVNHPKFNFSPRIPIARGLIICDISLNYLASLHFSEHAVKRPCIPCRNAPNSAVRLRDTTYTFRCSSLGGCRPITVCITTWSKWTFGLGTAQIRNLVLGFSFEILSQRMKQYTRPVWSRVAFSKHSSNLTCPVVRSSDRAEETIWSSDDLKTWDEQTHSRST